MVRKIVGVIRCLALGVLLATTAWPAAAQLPFTVTYVDWLQETMAQQGRVYRTEARDREILFCIEAWKKLAPEAGTERVIIQSLRRARGGQKNGIYDMGGECIGPNGESLPTLHTHDDGNCQFSRRDLVTIIARRAPFDGVQCGDRHFIWAFGGQLLAIANAVEMARLQRQP